VTELFLSPGERADVLVDLKTQNVGDVLFLKSLAFDPMHDEMGGMMGGMMGGGTHSSRLDDGAGFHLEHEDAGMLAKYRMVEESIRPPLRCTSPALAPKTRACTSPP
jgi:hypothetical protein